MSLQQTCVLFFAMQVTNNLTLVATDFVDFEQQQFYIVEVKRLPFCLIHCVLFSLFYNTCIYRYAALIMASRHCT